MNMQAMLKKAKELQKEMMETKREIDNKSFEEKSSIVQVKVKGNKKIEEIIIDPQIIKEEEVSVIEEILVITLNKAFDKIDKETEDKMGKFGTASSGLM